MVKVEGVSKKYHNKAVVDDISFDLRKGSIIGFLGPNGAGKTTTMKMLSGNIQPDSGSIEIFNKNIIKNRLDVQKFIGYLPEAPGGFHKLTVKEFLIFCCQSRTFSNKQIKQALDSVCSLIDLEPILDQRLELLSKGWKQRAWLAQAIIHDPPILFLDEPSDGLDLNQKDQLRKVIQQMSKDKVIMITTHILDEIEEMCEHIIMIANGKIVADEELNILIKKMGSIHQVFRKLTNS